MNVIDFFGSEICQRLLLTLGHSLWQGVLIASIALGVAALLRQNSSQARYLIYLGAMLLLAISVPITFAVVETNSPNGENVVVSANIPPGFPADSIDIRQDPDIRNDFSQPSGVLSPPISVEASPPSVLIDSTPDLHFDPIGLADEAPTRATVLETGIPWLMGAYFIGVALMLLRFAWSLVGARRLHKVSVPIEDPQILSAVARQAKLLGIKLAPPVAYCRNVAVPSVVGVLRPMILLPVSFLTQLSLAEVESLLAHELAHIRRFDPWMNVFQRLMEASLFFNPSVWILSRFVSTERENCCDDLVIQLGVQPTEYAQSLVKVAEINTHVSPAFAATLQATGRRSKLGIRVKRLLGIPQPERLTAMIGVKSLTAVLCTLGVGGAILLASPPATIPIPDMTEASPANSIEDPSETADEVPEKTVIPGEVVDDEAGELAGSIIKELETLAPKIPFLPASVVIRPRPLPRYLQGAELVAVQTFSDLASKHNSSVWWKVAKHPDPKVRTLAIIAISWKKQPKLLNQMFLLCNDDAQTFLAPPAPEIPGGNQEPRTGTPQTVGDFARQHIGRYMKEAGYSWGIERRGEIPGFERPGFEEYWETHKDCSDCYSWIRLSLKDVQFASFQYTSPSLRAAHENDSQALYAKLRKRIDALPMPRRAWTLLGLATPYRNSEVFEISGHKLANHADLVAAAKSLGKPALLDLLDDKLKCADPDIRINSDDNSSALYPSLSVRYWLILHASDLFEPSDVPRILAPQHARYRSDRLIAAAQLTPAKADAYLRTALELANPWNDRSRRSARACQAMWTLVGEPQKSLILDWFLAKQPNLDAVVDDGQTKFIQWLTDPLAHPLLEAICRDPRLSKLNWSMAVEFYRSANRLQANLITSDELSAARPAFGGTGYLQKGHFFLPSTENPITYKRDQATVDRVMGDWSKRILGVLKKNQDKKNHSGENPSIRGTAIDTGWTDVNPMGDCPKTHYPVSIELMPLKGDGVRFKAIFIPKPSENFDYSHALNQKTEEYRKLDTRLKKQGYIQISHQVVTVMVGNVHQAVWVRLAKREQDGADQPAPQSKSQGTKKAKPDAEVVEAESMSFVLEYPSPPPADSGVQFHEAITDLSMRLEDEGLKYNTQGFLGNHFYIHDSSQRAKRVLLDYSKNSPFKLNFLTQEGEQDTGGEESEGKGNSKLESEGRSQ